jgi:hypothetical protein
VVLVNQHEPVPCTTAAQRRHQNTQQSWNSNPI